MCSFVLEIQHVGGMLGGSDVSFANETALREGFFPPFHILIYI